MVHGRVIRGLGLGLTALFVALLAPSCRAYSVLTHEQIVDMVWDDSIRPLLLARFPKTTEAELLEAHAFAYGGCAVQDLGYYPFGKKFFSDLTHYVRSGDFVMNLFRYARTVNEYAFAAGALSHYLGDSIGHAYAVNPATALDFPKLQKRYGRAVTYEDSPYAHVRTEFGFDVGQLAAGRFAPQAYLDTIGLRVARRSLEQAFHETYGLELHKILGPEFPAIRSYRSAVRSFIPRFANAEVVLHRRHIQQQPPNEAFALYLEEVAHSDYQRWWSGAHQAPGIGAYLLAMVIPILPRIGPLSMLAIKDPRPETEELYAESVNRTVAACRRQLQKLRPPAVVELDLPNRDLDTGEKVKPGAYRRTDQTYAKLLDEVTAKPGRIRPGVKQDILEYYSDPAAPITTKHDRKAWERLLAQLAALRQTPVQDGRGAVTPEPEAPRSDRLTSSSPPE